ncbi:MAG TPA: S1-like domain-containing RNA-binding protein [Candidatus Paceibacterota bacterium]|nr:S1-like domain-containing RNA-binding protein [Candidatus Paceibacterota bacterium]
MQIRASPITGIADFAPGNPSMRLRWSRMAILGKRNTLSIVRASGPGLYLDGGELGEILLPGRYIPADLKPKDTLDVFVYRDSEDRLVATTEIPHATVGEFACMKVLSVNDRVGAFLDWGLAKDLLLPFREQEKPVRTGQRVVVFVYLDPKSQRIVASSRLHRHLSRELPHYRNSQPVNLLITGASPLGYKAIVENSHMGLLYRDKTTVPLQIGQRIQGYVRNVRPGGELDLSLDASGYKRVAPLTDQLVKALEENGGRLAFDDDSSPEAIRQKFSVSKKAFKQALGKLYKARRIRFTNPGIELLDNSSWSPGAR